MKRIEVLWTDTTTYSKWEDFDVVKDYYEKYGLDEKRSVGFELINNDKLVVLVQSITIDAETHEIKRGADYLAIPKSCVTAIKLLEH